MKLAELKELSDLLEKVFPLPIAVDFQGKHHIILDASDNTAEVGIWTWTQSKELYRQIFVFDLSKKDAEINEQVLLEAKALLINQKAMHQDYSKCDSDRARELPEIPEDSPSVIIQSRN